MNNIIITGGLGHIGSALIRKINATVCDNFETQRFCSLFNIETKITFINNDFINIDIPKNSIVIHLAAITDAANAYNNEKINIVNIDKTKKFIDKCITSEVSKFIFPSSTSVYGKAITNVFENDITAENPQSKYAESKLIIEKYIEQTTLNYNILRFGTIYGITPGMRFHTAINKFCFQAALNEPITIWKENYTQYRPYLGINDAINVILYCIHKRLPNREKFNVITNNYTVENIIDIIKKYINVSLNFVDTPLLNQYSYFVNCDKIKKYGITFNDNIEIVIRDTINLFKNINK